MAASRIKDGTEIVPKHRKGKGEVIALYPLMPDRMTVDRDDKGRLYYEYQMQDSDAHTMKQGTVRLSPYDVLHIPGLGFDGLVGYSPIAMAKNAIGLAISAEEYGSKFFVNGAMVIVSVLFAVMALL